SRQVRMSSGLHRRMTARAFRAIPRHGIGATRNIVRVVARVAGQAPAAVTEACRLAKTIRLIDDLEAVAAFGHIEMHYGGAEGLTRTEGKDVAVEAADHLRQLDARGLQMALHADVHLERGREACRVHDGGANLLNCRAPRCQVGMPPSIVVAPLAVDALGHPSVARVAIVAEEAAIVRSAGKVARRALVEPGAQVPALLLRVPRKRQ